MTTLLRSYLCGQWMAGEGDGSPLYDPTTEDILARSSTRGLDFRAALAYARERGTPALQGLTFAQRGELLAAVAKSIHSQRDDLIELALANGGNTRSDAKFDIDGAIVTLTHYAKVAQNLGARRLLPDGELEQLGKSPRFVGAHVFVPYTGVAVHINAFNFPAWGFAEKAAVALLAGLAVVSKPATSTALVAARIVEGLVAGQVLPDGALSFIAGSPGDLLDHLRPQDVVAFTGSSQTGIAIKSKPNVVAGNIRVNIEADSLNAAVLGPDVEPDSPTYELFLREVLQDMTQKCGQKCTAIRRVFVSSARLADARRDLAERLAEIKVGNPNLREVRVGPLATRDQLRDVVEGIGRLRRDAELVRGDGSRGTLHGLVGDKGYFVSPTLLHAPQPDSAHEVHGHEVFGPVATLMGYAETAQQAAALVRLGQGGLVASVYSDDRAFAAQMVAAIGPFHGRIHLGSAKMAEHSPGPGTVLPALVHGGPGRAGGGEELGGPRGLAFYMQRVALQGDRPLLESILTH